MQSSLKRSVRNASTQGISSANRVTASGTALRSAIQKSLATDSSRSKYRNKKTEVDGILFDSKHEAHRWIELRYMERAGLIRELKRQVAYELIPKQRTKGGKTIRAAQYVADFVYEINGETIVEDAKGVRTEVYKLKKKLMLEKYGIEIHEV